MWPVTSKASVVCSLAAGSGDGVCKLSQTCCSSEAEDSLKMSTAKDRRNEVIESLSELVACRNPSIFSECVLS